MPRIDNPIKPVRRLKISDSVAAQLELLITQGVYEVGERLPAERELAERFGVGRSTMREALRLVEAEGMLRIDHGVGVFVIRDSRRSEHGRGLLLVDTVSQQWGYYFPADEDDGQRNVMHVMAVVRHAQRQIERVRKGLKDVLAAPNQAGQTDGARKASIRNDVLEVVRDQVVQGRRVRVDDLQNFLRALRRAVHEAEDRNQKERERNRCEERIECDRLGEKRGAVGRETKRRRAHHREESQ